MSDHSTRGVRIQVKATYLPEQSSPRERRWVFAYHVTISNQGDEPVRLESRHWVITDGSGNVEEVRGPGVVGQTPRLLPGESFEYTSGCPLRTAVGTMHGAYRMVTDAGGMFDAEIAPFTLACPDALN